VSHFDDASDTNALAYLPFPKEREEGKALSFAWIGRGRGRGDQQHNLLYGDIDQEFSFRQGKGRKEKAP